MDVKSEMDLKIGVKHTPLWRIEKASIQCVGIWRHAETAVKLAGKRESEMA